MSAAATRFEEVTLFGFRLTRTGLQPADPKHPPSYDNYESLGDYLSWMQESLPWLMGDYVEYGEAHFKERASQVVDATGWQYETVQQCARVARSIPIERRDPDLSWTHHREVSDLAPAQQVQMLAKAKHENWSTAELRSHLRKEGKVETTYWLLVGCKSDHDRTKLQKRLELEGRSCKLP